MVDILYSVFKVLTFPFIMLQSLYKIKSLVLNCNIIK